MRHGVACGLLGLLPTVAALAGLDQLRSAEPPPPTRLPSPEITFRLDGEGEASPDEDRADWKDMAGRAASLQQLGCDEDLLGATRQMLGAAEDDGDSLAMAALGTMYLLGQSCAPKRNLTWAVHWLTRAEELGQADAQALMGFLHASNVLREVYDYDGFVANVTRGRELYEQAAHGGSAFAAMAIGFRHAYGVGLRESCPDSAAMYEKAAAAAVAGLDEQRKKQLEQSNPVESDHLQLLAKTMPRRERMDAGTIEYLDYCAHIGDVTGQVAMGRLYHAGTHGVPCDRRAAQAWFRSAAHQGDSTGHASLGFMEMRERRYRSALRSLRRATRQNDPSGSASAWAGLGYAYMYGAGVPQNDKRAAQAIWTAARMGHLDSIYNIGVLTLKGKGVPASVMGGFRFLSVAAEFSHPQAQLHVGHMIRLGLGVRKDCNAAQFFLKHAAEAGPLVRSLMGTALTAHEHGRTQRALVHYLLAAHAGVLQAQHNVGHLYAHEMGRMRKAERPVYRKRAAQYFRFAALQNSVDAQVQLANLLADEGDYTTAARLYQEAGRAGNTDALFHLGMLYWAGKGVKPSAKTAFALWQSSDFKSKHAELKGLQKPIFGLARFVVEFRAFLLFAAGIVAIVSTGGNPVDVVRRALSGGGAEGGEGMEGYGDEDMDDLFGDDD